MADSIEEFSNIYICQCRANNTLIWSYCCLGDRPFPSPLLPSVPFSSSPLMVPRPPFPSSPSPNPSRGRKRILTFLKAFAVLKARVVETSFIHLYAMQMAVFLFFVLCSEKLATFRGFQPVSRPLSTAV